MPKSDALVSITNYLVKYGIAKDGFEISACLRDWKASSVVVVPMNNSPFFNIFVRGLEMRPKFLTNFL